MEKVAHLMKDGTKAGITATTVAVAMVGAVSLSPDDTKTVTPCPGDINRDGRVNLADLQYIKSGFFQQCAAPPEGKTYVGSVAGWYDPATGSTASVLEVLRDTKVVVDGDAIKVEQRSAAPLVNEQCAKQLLNLGVKVRDLNKQKVSQIAATDDGMVPSECYERD